MRIFKQGSIGPVFLFLLGLTTVAALFTSAAGKSGTLAIIPLTVHAGQDLSYLAEGAADMLGSRIAASTGVMVMDTGTIQAAMAGESRSINRSVAESVGDSLGADYILFGSITRLGQAFSLDIRLVDLTAKKETAAFFQQADTLDDIIPAINTIAEAVSRSVSGSFYEMSGRTPLAVSPDGPKSPSDLHPETLMGAVREVSATAEQSVAGRTSFIKADEDHVASDFWKSQDLEMEIIGLAVADLSGDRKNEIVLLAGDCLYVRRLEQGRFHMLAERRAARHERFLSVDTADTDGDGRAEIFVSAVNRNSGKLTSLVLELSREGLTEVAQQQNWFFRTMGEAAAVFGQKKGRTDAFIGDVSAVFSPGIWRLEREGADYVPRDRIQAPDSFNLFAVTRGRAREPGTIDHIAVDQNERLRIYDEAGQLLWTSLDHFAGSELYLTSTEDSGNDIGRRFYLPQRVIISDAAAGRGTVITVSHSAVGGRLFARFRRYSQSSFVGLAWDGLGLAEVWRTRPVSGYIADFAVADLDNDGRRELIGGVVMSRSSGISKPRSCVVRYNMDNNE